MCWLTTAFWGTFIAIRSWLGISTVTEVWFRCFKGEKWTSKAIVKINIIICLEYICIYWGLPAFSFSLGVNYCCVWKNALFHIFGVFFGLNLPSSCHFFSTARGSAALASPSLKAGANLRKGWRTLSAVFLLLAGITGRCQELSCPKSEGFACPWSKQHSWDATRELHGFARNQRVGGCSSGLGWEISQGAGASGAAWGGRKSSVGVSRELAG